MHKKESSFDEKYFKANTELEQIEKEVSIRGVPKSFGYGFFYYQIKLSLKYFRNERDFTTMYI
jgi:hypothetical protein